MSYGSFNNSGCITAIGGFFLIVVLAAALGLLFAFPEMWLWNWLVPKLFNGPVISYWEMVGLHVLASLLIPRGTSTTTSK